MHVHTVGRVNFIFTFNSIPLFILTLILALFRAKRSSEKNKVVKFKTTNLP